MRIYDIAPHDLSIVDPAGRPAPVDPMTGEPKIPAGTTTSAPPSAGAHEIARWTEGTWALTPDWRGHVYWLADSSRHEITEIGVAPPADALDEAPLEPIATLANRQRAMIESALAAALRAGMPYTLPDGSEDVIQTRPEEDEANLLGLAIEARDRRAAGDTDASMAMRAQSNTVYSLTPAQMIALTDAAKAFKQGLLAHSWQLKDAIAAAEAAGDREAIEAVGWEAAA